MTDCDPKAFTRMRALNRATINAISFQESGWQHIQGSQIEQSWSRDDGETILMATIHNRPCHPTFEHDTLPKIINRAGGTHQTGCLVSADSVQVRSGRAAMCVTKLKQRFGGTTYQGILVLPFKNCHITFVVKCEERHDIGARETAVYNELSTNPSEAADGKKVAHSRNPMEDERWDDYFPDHPLTRVRKYLKLISRTFNYNPRVLEPLYGEKKPWWSHFNLVALVAPASRSA